MKNKWILILLILCSKLTFSATVTMNNGTTFTCYGHADDVAGQVNSCGTTLCCCNEGPPGTYAGPKHCFNPKEVSTVSLIKDDGDSTKNPLDGIQTNNPTSILEGGSSKNPIIVAIGLIAIALAIYFKRK